MFKKSLITGRVNAPCGQWGQVALHLTIRITVQIVME